jgi:hypothetical protein
MNTVKRLQIFLASPGDVSAERRLAQQIVDDLNRVLPDEKGVVLQLVRWEADAYPGYGKDPQQVINAQLAEMRKYALFIGILWNRLGTRTPRAGSGTEEEFERAVEAHQQAGQPEIWLYFRDSPAKLETADQLAQKKRVVAFRKRIQAKGLVWTYKKPQIFKDTLRAHLTQWVNSRAGTASRAPVAVASEQTDAPRPEDDKRLVITLDPDFDFIGGDEGAQTAAYRFLSAARNEQQVQAILKCDAVGIAAVTIKQLQSQTKRTADEEWRLRHTMKIQEHCAEAAYLFSRSFNYVWYRSQFKHELFLSLEESLAELLIGLRDRLFRSAPMLPDHTETPEWSKAMRQRTVQRFAWHVDHPERYLIVDLTTEELKGLEDYYHRWTGFDFSESSACPAHGLPMKALQRAVAPTIALDLVKRFKSDEIDENLSDLTHWLVGASHPDKALSRFTWEEMTRKQSGK